MVWFMMEADGQRNRMKNQPAPGNRQNLDPAALLIGAAGLAALAGTAGFVGGFVVGESDQRFRPGNRRPVNRFRGKRSDFQQNGRKCLAQLDEPINAAGLDSVSFG